MVLCGATLSAALAGCEDVAPIYTQGTGGYMGASITPKTSWTVSGNLNDLKAAIDGNVNTAAHSTQYQYEGSEITLDLKGMCLFQTIIIDHGKESEGYARLVAVKTSADGREFKDRYTGVGSQRVTLLLLPEPVLARYIRLQVVRAGYRPWAVGEIYIQ